MCQIIHDVKARQKMGRLNVYSKCRMTPESAWLFAEAFGTSPEFWLNLQSNYDLVRSKPKRQVARIAAIA